MTDDRAEPDSGLPTDLALDAFNEATDALDDSIEEHDNERQFLPGQIQLAQTLFLRSIAASLIHISRTLDERLPGSDG